MLSRPALEALDLIATGLVDVGNGIRQFASALEAEGPEATGDGLSLDARDVEELWKRLGAGNRELLAVSAATYQPGEPFTLDDMADAVGASPGTVKARLMNIGRSLKSMGNDFTVLWDSEWGLLHLTYVWREEAHRVITEKARP